MSLLNRLRHEFSARRFAGQPRWIQVLGWAGLISAGLWIVGAFAMAALAGIYPEITDSPGALVSLFMLIALICPVVGLSAFFVVHNPFRQQPFLSEGLQTRPVMMKAIWLLGASAVGLFLTLGIGMAVVWYDRVDPFWLAYPITILLMTALILYGWLKDAPPSIPPEEWQRTRVHFEKRSLFLGFLIPYSVVYLCVRLLVPFMGRDVFEFSTPLVSLFHLGFIGLAAITVVFFGPADGWSPLVWISRRRALGQAMAWSAWVISAVALGALWLYWLERIAIEIPLVVPAALLYPVVMALAGIVDMLLPLQLSRSRPRTAQPGS